MSGEWWRAVGLPRFFGVSCNARGAEGGCTGEYGEQGTVETGNLVGTPYQLEISNMFPSIVRSITGHYFYSGSVYLAGTVNAFVTVSGDVDATNCGGTVSGVSLSLF
jgi:hypothetical protein